MNHHTWLTVVTAAPPVITVFYVALEYFGIFDYITRRGRANEGLIRLRSTAGYPKSYIFDDGADRFFLRHSFGGLQKKTTNKEALAKLKSGEVPTLIATAGKPIVIEGTPGEWPQETRHFYSSEHPVIVSFGTVREGGKPGIAVRICSLGELEGWLNSERDGRRLKLGGFLVGLISFILIALRLALMG